MLIKYNGEYTRETRAYGCSKCGTGHSINGRAVYKTSDRTYYEGRLYIFKQDEPVEVDEILGSICYPVCLQILTEISRTLILMIYLPQSKYLRG